MCILYGAACFVNHPLWQTASPSRTIKALCIAHSWIHRQRLYHLEPFPEFVPTSRLSHHKTQLLATGKAPLHCARGRCLQKNVLAITVPSLPAYNAIQERRGETWRKRRSFPLETFSFLQRRSDVERYHAPCRTPFHHMTVSCIRQRMQALPGCLRGRGCNTSRRLIVRVCGK